MALKPRGRPADHPDRELRAEILAVFGVMGPHVGLPILQELFPDVARGELVELQRRYRFAYRRKSGWLMYTLRWKKPGRIWTADFTDLPHAIDGCFTKLVVVRDLASGRNLLALPAESASAAVLLDALEALIARYGAPLVFKSDNGSAFIASEVGELLARYGVLHLLSPPRTPRYNGSVEAGIGSLKVRAHYEAARHDHPGWWNCDDVEAARLQANHTARPFGPLESTPQRSWEARSLIDSKERRAFRQVYDRRQREELLRRDQQLLPLFGRAAETSVDRIAISQALIECGYLLVRRRRVSPPIVRHRVRNIS